MKETVATQAPQVPTPRVPTPRAPTPRATDRAAGGYRGMVGATVPPAVDLVIAVGATTWRLGARGAALVGRGAGPAIRLAGRLPVVGPELQAAPRTLTERGRMEREAVVARTAAVCRALVPALADAILDQLDLTRLVLDRVDLDAVVAEVDIDAVVARVDVDAVVAHLDVDAVVARVDLAGIVYEVLDAIDLPQIIWESTGSVASETVRTVRMQSMDLDEHVNRFVNRVLLRRGDGRRATITEPDADGPTAPPVPRQQPTVRP